MFTLFTDIHQLLLAEENPSSIRKGNDMKNLSCLNDAWLLIENESIKSFGKMEDISTVVKTYPNYKEINCSGRIIMPAFVDSHTHLVFAATREKEFVDKINGLTYEEIAARGGGILNSAQALKNADENQLFNDAWNRLQRLISYGTGAIEIKSGYGLSLEGELKMLRVIQHLKEKSPIHIKSTFLGAHAFPAEYKNNQEGYINLIIHEMLPKIHAEKLADYVDVFCENNYFNTDQTERILNAAIKYGLKPRLHVNQFNSIGGIKKAIEMNAISVDHLEVLNDEDLDALASSETIATLLPGCSLFSNLPFAPARKLIEKNIGVALASDYNPGSAPSGNMQLVISLACMRMKMLPEEAIIASTINGATAMELEGRLGTMSPGKEASFIITHPMNYYTYIPYSFGENHVSEMYIKGKKWE
jgi:imidazolonepropionase